MRDVGNHVGRAVAVGAAVGGGVVLATSLWVFFGTYAARQSVTEMCGVLEGSTFTREDVSALAHDRGLRFRVIADGEWRVAERFVGFSAACRVTSTASGTLSTVYSERW